jgi:hypothetical protein
MSTTEPMTKESAPLVDLGYVEPQLHFSSSTVHNWRRKGYTMAELRQALEHLRKEVKVASRYFYDNSHFFIDYGGTPSISFHILNDNLISMWEVNHGRSIGSFEEIPAELSEMLHNIQRNRVPCAVCHQWFGDGEWVHFSFAGAVCKEHYDPKVHKPPDTRGD